MEKDRAIRFAPEQSLKKLLAEEAHLLIHQVGFDNSDGSLMQTGGNPCRWPVWKAPDKSSAMNSNKLIR